MFHGLFGSFLVGCAETVMPIVEVETSIPREAKVTEPPYALSMPDIGNDERACQNPLSNARVKATWLNPVPGLILSVDLSGQGLNGSLEEESSATWEVERTHMTVDRPEISVCWSQMIVQELTVPPVAVPDERVDLSGAVYRLMTFPKLKANPKTFSLPNDLQFMPTGEGRGQRSLSPPFEKVIAEVAVEFAVVPGEYELRVGPFLYGDGEETIFDGKCSVSRDYVLSCSD